MLSITLRSCVDLCRISNLPTIWTNVLAAMLLSGATFQWHPYLILACSLSFFYAGGMCLNDICDREHDLLQQPFRPIPSGRVLLKYAVLLSLFLFATGMSLLLTIPHPTAAFCGGVALLATIVAYDAFHKGNFLSVFLMATCRLMVFIVTALALAGVVSPYVVLAGCVQFLYVLAISIVARHENERGKRYPFSAIPLMLCFISVLDGVVMAVFVSPAWLAAGVAGAVFTRIGQRIVRGD